MSPEQARGQEVDKRSDIWSFGVLVYEMLVGVQLFQGDTATDILGAIVHRRPEWDRLPESTPPGLVKLLKRCLTMELSERLRDIGEARYALAHLGEAGQDVDPGRVGETTRVKELVRVGAAFAVNCVASLETELAAAEAAGIPREEIAQIVKLSAFIKERAASHVERLCGMRRRREVVNG